MDIIHFTRCLCCNRSTATHQISPEGKCEDCDSRIEDFLSKFAAERDYDEVSA